MRPYGIKRLLKVCLCAFMVLLVIGIFCYVNITPVDAVAGATSSASELQEDGAISHLISGESR